MPDPTAQLPPLSHDNILHATITAGIDIPANLPTQQTPIEFTLLRVAGEGGMGIVYRALQHYPRRVVALKIFKSSVASPSAAKRFHREIGVLARLHHPGIAQLYSVGATSPSLTGQSAFIAMEFIDGLPLTTFATQRNLDIRARVRLMIQVCDALTYLHQQFIIHRDLKPTNILVDAQGNPKLIDFGLAWITDNDNPATLVTQTGELVGTLEYMAPEQASANHAAIDARADVYSLGIVLYELLAGRRPFNLSAHSLVDAALAIAHAVPEKLSAHNHHLAGDLETIVHTAIQKDPSQRYKTVAAIAEDLRRFLADVPILAATPSAGYRLRKFLRRNRRPLFAVAAVVFALLLGWIAVVIQQQRLTREAQRTTAANRQADTRLAEADLAQGDALALADNLDAARDSYNRALATLQDLHASTLPAELALWQLNLTAAQPLHILEPHADSLSALALSRDQKLLALGFADGRYEVRDYPANTTRFSLIGPRPRDSNGYAESFSKPGLIQALTFSPNATTLAVFSNSRWFYVNIATQAATDPWQNEPASSTAFFLDDHSLLALSAEGNPYILSTVQGALLPLTTNVGPFLAGARTTDGGLFVDESRFVIHWIKSPFQIPVIGRIPIDYPDAFVFSPGASLLAVPTSTAVTLFTTFPFHQTVTIPLDAATRFAGFASPTTLLFADRQHSVVRAVDLTGQLIGTIPTRSPHLLVAHDNLIIHLDPHNQLTASALMRPQEVRTLLTSDEPITAIALSPDATRAALATAHSLRLLDTTTNTILETRPLATPVTSFRFTDANTLLLNPPDADTSSQNLVTENNTLTFLDPTDHHVLRAIPFPFRLAIPTPDARHALLIAPDNTALLLTFPR